MLFISVCLDANNWSNETGNTIWALVLHANDDWTYSGILNIKNEPSSAGYGTRLGDENETGKGVGQKGMSSVKPLWSVI